jgi:predicted dehydrogenase
MVTTTNKVKLGIIGLGAFGKKIIKPLRHLHSEEEISVTAVCDNQPEIAEQFAKDNRVPNWFTDYRDIISSTDVDLVYIATPPATHKEISIFAIKNKKHVFCEKPLANSLHEAKELMELTRGSGLVNALHFHLNYSPILKKFSKLIDEEYIGKLRRISVILRYPNWPPEWQKNSWIETREQGGFILEQGVHIIQAIQNVFGKIVSVQSEVQYPNDSNSCGNGIIARMELIDGTPILIDGLSYVPEEENVELIAYGSRGKLSIKNWRKLMGSKLGNEYVEIQTDHPSSHPWIMKHIIDAINGKPSIIYDFATGYETQVVIEALRNPKSNKSIELIY